MTTAMKIHDDESVVWNAVYDAVSLSTGDPDSARRDADQTIQLIRLGKSAQKFGVWDAVLDALGSVFMATRRMVGVLLVIAAVLAVAAGFGWFVYTLTTHNDRDYAGYGPKKATAHAALALREWYGLNDMPSTITLVGQQHARLLGQDAWKLRYRTGSGKLVCAWVWKGATDTNPSKVAEGADCGG